jgi:hypothetical protein
MATVIDDVLEAGLFTPPPSEPADIARNEAERKRLEKAKEEALKKTGRIIGGKVTRSKIKGSVKVSAIEQVMACDAGDFRKILGVTRDATQDQILKAYAKKLVLTNVPKLNAEEAAQSKWCLLLASTHRAYLKLPQE